VQEARLTGSGAGAPCLAVDELRVAYGGVVAVDGVSLTVAPGRITVLLGANGAGKTSTQRGIGGLQRVGRGTAVSLAGRRVERLDPAARARAGLGHCLEDRHVFPRLSVEENLALGTLSARGRSPTPLAEVYALFPELEARRDVHAGKLSGGQQQERGRPLGRVRMAPSRRCGAVRAVAGEMPLRLPRPPPPTPRCRRARRRGPRPRRRSSVVGCHFSPALL
jgi:ABC-type transport system involved in cytochrome c biogenesis ATPase subunit